nr:hypothetical protein [Limosilactobacillus mucosae]
MDKIKVFPIIITKNEDDTDFPYFVEIPDIDGMTEGKSIVDAIEMAKDYLVTYSLKDQLPESNTELPKVKDGAIAMLVSVRISK